MRNDEENKSTAQIFDHLILECPFTSLKEVADNLPVKFYGFRVLKLFSCSVVRSWRSIDIINEITLPILFIHGTKDDLVPSFMSHKLRWKANNSPHTHVWEIEGGTHNDLHQQFHFYIKVDALLNYNK